MSNVLVLGDAIVDLVFGGVERYPARGEEVVAPRFELRPGGSAGYTALGLAALGVDVTVATTVGDDTLSGYWLDFLTTQGVDITHVTHYSDAHISTAAAFLFQDDRSFVTYRGVNETGNVPTVDVDTYDALLITGFSQAPYLWDGGARNLARTFADHNRPVLLDTNWSTGQWERPFLDLLPFVDTLLVNDQEARRLSGCDSLTTAGRVLIDDGAGACVIKDGNHGCLLVDGAIHRVETDAVNPIDTCGAGDFFNAGYLDAALAGSDRRDAASAGNRSARTAITRFAIREKLNALANV